MHTITLTTIDNEFIFSDRCKDNTVLKTLTRAVHEETMLSYVYLRSNNLTGIKLLDAWLPNSNLTSCVLIDSDLRGTNLGNSDLSYSDLEGADLRRVNLTNTNLKGVNLKGTDLRGARLVEAKYTKKQIDSAITNETTIFQE